MAKQKHTVRITREVSYVEVVDAEVMAANDDEVTEIAQRLGNGEAANWPSVRKYNVFEREPVETRYINSTFELSV